MSLLGDRTASFILRIWREPGELGEAGSEWRGSIEHVGSGRRKFFRELDVILKFLRPHIEAIGIDADQRFWERIAQTLDEPADDEPAAPAAPPHRKHAAKR
jgi:hypothetical protein